MEASQEDEAMLLPNLGIEFSIKEVMRGMSRGAKFSDCRKYRPRLYRDWDRGRLGVLFIMLNPSVADERREDRTVRRCIGLAHWWGYGWLEVRNLFSLCSTNPRVLYKEKDPVGPDNPLVYDDDRFDRIIVAWGNNGKLLNRGEDVLRMLKSMKKPVFHLGMTKVGQPVHPLYIKGDTKPSLVNLLDFEEVWGKNK
jgi:hypothetical protein